MNFKTNLEGITSLFLITTTVCLYNPIIFIPSIVLIFILWWIKVFFTPFMTYSRICDNVTRAPLNTELSSTLQGLIVIRAYGQAETYVQKYQQKLYENVLAILAFSRTNTMLSCFLEFAVLLQMTLGSALVIRAALQEGQIRDPGELGFSLLLLIQTGDNFANCFRSFFLIQINMNSVQRMLSLTELESEAPLEMVNDSKLGRGWPTEGRIEFKNVKLRYDAQLGGTQAKFALDGVSFTVEPGMRIGIVGRTGAGKSTILQALFRMVEIEKSPGEGIFIDGLPIDQLGLHILRGRLSVIPQ